MTSTEYAKELVSDIVVLKLNSIEIELRLGNLILLAQNEGMSMAVMRLNPDLVIGDLITEPTPENQKI